MLLSCQPEDKVCRIGFVYVRLFLPIITSEVLKFSNMAEKDASPYAVIEETLKTFFALATAQGDQRLSIIY